MAPNARKFLLLTMAILQAGCAELNLTASQEQAPIESREPVVISAGDSNEGTPAKVDPDGAKQALPASEVISISPLETNEIGAPEPIDTTSNTATAQTALPGEIESSDATQQLLADARRSFVTGDLANAEAITNRGLRIAPQDPALWIQLAKIRLGQKSYGEAISLGERAQVLAEDNLAAQIDALQVIATAERARGNPARAAEVEKQALSLKGRLGRY